jgi:hypothetical protein
MKKAVAELVSSRGPVDENATTMPFTKAAGRPNRYVTDPGFCD